MVARGDVISYCRPGARLELDAEPVALGGVAGFAEVEGLPAWSWVTRFSTSKAEPGGDVEQGGVAGSGGLGSQAGSAYGRDVAALDEGVVEGAVLQVGSFEQQCEGGREDRLLDGDRLVVDAQATDGDHLLSRFELEPGRLGGAWFADLAGEEARGPACGEEADRER